jgi:hypothetical protein
VIAAAAADPSPSVRRAAEQLLDGLTSEALPAVLEAVRTRRAAEPQSDELAEVEERLVRMTAVEVGEAEPVPAG